MRRTIARAATLLLLTGALAAPAARATQTDRVDPTAPAIAALSQALRRGADGVLLSPRESRDFVLGRQGTSQPAHCWYDPRRGVLTVSVRGGAQTIVWPVLRIAAEREGARHEPYLTLPPRTAIAGAAGGLVTLTFPSGDRFVTTAPAALDSLYFGGPELLPVLATQLRGLVPAGDRWGAAGFLDRFGASAPIDSVTQAFGPVAAVVPMRRSQPGVLGIYHHRHDRIELDPSMHAHEGDLLLTWVHEYAHALQRRRGAALDRLFAKVAPVTVAGVYGAGNRREQQAEALAFAWGFLRATSDTSRIVELGASSQWGQALWRRLRSDSALAALPLDAPAADRARAALDRLDHLVPGTGLMTALLLGNRIWADHPLREDELYDEVVRESAGGKFWVVGR